MYQLCLCSQCRSYEVQSPYNVIMAVNLEPIYSILLALVLFGESESMNISFYFGALLIIGAVSLDGYLKKKIKKS